MLGFESPIRAGILIAVLIPWIRHTAWPPAGGLGKVGFFVSATVECMLLYMLTLTGSRGPILALLVTYAIEIGLSFRFKEYTKAKQLMLRNAVAVLAIILFSMASGVGKHFAEAAAFADGSVLNRIEILKNSRALLMIDPVNGCGWGWSPHYYSQ